MRPLSKALGIVVVAMIVIGAAAIWQLNRFLDSPVSVPEDGAGFEIAPGTPFATVSQRLADAGIIAQPTLLRMYARVSGKAGSVHAGEYFIEPGTTTAGLLEQFTSGDVLLYSFTIVEGWNQWDLLRALHAHPQIDARMSEEDCSRNWAPTPATRKACSCPRPIISRGIPATANCSSRRMH